MANKSPSPLQASFWLSEQERRYILVVCALFLIGLAARYFYLINETATAYTSAGVEKGELDRE